MHPIFVDIENEFSEISEEAERLSNRLARLASEGPLSDFQEKWEATHVCASAAEKVYTGCERVMFMLASDIDGAALTHSDGWAYGSIAPDGESIPGSPARDHFGRVLRSPG